MIHTLHIPCPQCGTLLVDFDGPDCSFDRNWGCLHCSAAWDGYGERQHVMHEKMLTREHKQMFQDALDLFDGLFGEDV